MSKQYWYIFAGVLVIGILVIGAYRLRSPQPNPTLGQSATTTPTPTATTTSASTGAQGASGQTVTVLSSSASGIPAPSLNHQVAFSADLSADRVAALRADIASTIAVLKQNSSTVNVQYWLQLALDYKQAGDYQGAIQVWTYLSKAVPGSYIAYADLGGLYMNFLKDYPKAEANYQKAITLNQTDTDLYRNLYTLYVWQGNTAAASSTLAAGLKANPGNSDLLSLQQQLQASQH